MMADSALRGRLPALAAAALAAAAVVLWLTWSPASTTRQLPASPPPFGDGSATTPTADAAPQTQQQSRTADSLQAPVHRVYVVGCGHSGTSLLLRSIGNLPGVRCIPQESHVFLGGKADGGDAERRRVLQGWDADAAAGNFSAWVEKTPRHVYHIDDMLRMGPPGGVRVIFIHRDGREVAASMKPRGYSWAKGVSRWVDDNSAALPHLGSAAVLDVKFAELTSAAGVLRTLRRVAAFLDLTPGDDKLALALFPGTKEHETQEYCKPYLNDERKAEDLRASLVQTLAARGAAVEAAAAGFGASEAAAAAAGGKRNKNGETSAKLEAHNALRTWQMTQAWAEVSAADAGAWSAAEEKAFWAREDAAAIMRRLGYVKGGGKDGVGGRRRAKKTSDKANAKKQARKEEVAAALALQATLKSAKAAATLPDLGDAAPGGGGQALDPPPGVELRWHKGEELPSGVLDWAFDLTKRHMRALYDDCEGWGWNDGRKRRELCNADARLIVAYAAAAADERAAPPLRPRLENDSGDAAAEARCGGAAAQQGEQLGAPLGFVHLRFEAEGGGAVLYVYEVQVESAAQGKGLGRCLMRLAERAAARHGVPRLMLTVFHANAAARRMYQRLGYLEDATSPGAVDPGGSHGYSILTKQLAAS